MRRQLRVYVRGDTDALRGTLEGFCMKSPPNLSPRVLRTSIASGQTSPAARTGTLPIGAATAATPPPIRRSIIPRYEAHGQSRALLALFHGLGVLQHHLSHGLEQIPAQFKHARHGLGVLLSTA